jgi:hypothetical protein
VPAERDGRMSSSRSDLGLLIAAATLIAAAAFWYPPAGRAQSTPSPIVGAWVLNPSLTDRPPAPAASHDQNGRTGRRGGRSGFGGRGFGGGFQGAGASRDEGDRSGRGADIQRRQDAMRDLITAPERLTIVETDSMVIITAGDGRTTRLAPDDSKIKDESTGAERRTHWDGGKLVSAITGLGPGTITETYSEQQDPHRLTVTIEMPGRGADQAPVTIHHVYDAQPQ